ncbi:MAG: hypothetical protein ACREQ7_10205 [Candidatus Binatia bacterium]
MRTRDKLVVVLFTVTLALGGVILLHSRENDDAIRRFRSFFSNPPARSFPDIPAFIGDPGSLWYGGISLVAIVMMGLTFRLARGGRLKMLGERPAEPETTEPPAEKLLSERALKEKSARQANDAPSAQDREGSARRVKALETALIEKEELLQRRDGELEDLQSKVAALRERAREAESARREGESALREELENKTDLLQAKGLAADELEKSLREEIRSLESQIREKDELLKSRGQEVEALRAELNTVTEQRSGLASAKKESVDLLRDDLRKKTAAMAAKDSLMRELQENARKTVYALKSQLDQRERLLSTRDRELEARKSEINVLTARLRESRAGGQAEHSLQAKRPSQATDVNPATPEGGSRSVQDLQRLLGEKEELLKTRDRRIERLDVELKEKRTQLARHEIEIRQSMERRDLWKRRFAKLGIPLKD